VKWKTQAALNRLLRYLQVQEQIRSSGKRVRPAIQRKTQVVDEIKNNLKNYRTLVIVGLEGVRNQTYKALRRVLSKYGIIKVYKNSLVLRAMKELGLPYADEVAKYLTGTNAFFFTNLNAFEAAMLIEKVGFLRYAKPGEIAPADIYLPEGPTGIPPGPMLSVFGKLRVKTMVREGVIWIQKETKVAKAGEEIGPELSSLLRKLGIKTIVEKAGPKVAIDEGLVIPGEKLKLDIDEFRDELLRAAAIAKELSIEAALPLPDVLPEIIKRAYVRAIALAAEAGYVVPETAEDVIKLAQLRALSLAAALQAVEPGLNFGVATPSPAQAAAPQPAGGEEKKEEEEEEEKEEVSEEELGAGLEGLFF
jgi:large subunit ribosomal protein L10